ncbi:DUF3592 domain-containing protein [Arthrobacter sp. zg-ZUI227]|uniref:DUF3592 domain-containing protein n=1 Tax=Arthrobacter jiangjiafuii TaxID=2817475 RepID=UPI001AED5F1B|nr:DUF3592 domain-containing protein [Arthrobacter jiangjiafuii]
MTTLLCGVIVLVFGIYFGISNVSEAKEDQRIMAEGVRTVGTITDVQTKKGRSTRSGVSGGGRKVMDVSYFDKYGGNHSLSYRETYREKKEGSQEAVEKKLVGTEVNVRYDRSDPGKAVVEGDETSVTGAYVWGIGVGLFGLVFVAVGVWELKKRRASLKAGDAAGGSPTPAAG